MFKEIFLNCLLMDNGEVMFNGRSLGFLKKNEIEKYVISSEDVIKTLRSLKNKNVKK